MHVHRSGKIQKIWHNFVYLVLERLTERSRSHNKTYLAYVLDPESQRTVSWNSAAHSAAPFAFPQRLGGVEDLTEVSTLQVPIADYN